MGDDVTEELKALRAELDAHDVELIKMLAARFEIIRKVGRYKRRAGIVMMQHGRVESVREGAVTQGIPLGIEPDFMREFFRVLVTESCRVEGTVVDGLSS